MREDKIPSRHSVNRLWDILGELSRGQLESLPPDQREYWAIRKPSKSPRKGGQPRGEGMVVGQSPRKYNIQRAEGSRKIEQEPRGQVNLSPSNLEQQAFFRGDNQKQQVRPRDSLRPRYKSIYCIKDEFFSQSSFTGMEGTGAGMGGKVR